MAVLLSSPPQRSSCSSSSSSSSSISWISLFSFNSFSFLTTQLSVPPISCSLTRRPIRVSNVFTHQRTITVDKSKLRVSVGTSEDELWAAACLRVRTFNQLRPDTYAVDDHKRYLAEHEYEAIKERIAGKRVSFKRVSCINATLPLAEISTLPDDLCSTCKFSDNREDRVVVGSLDLNQCIRLPDEIEGMKPEGIGADFARAYLSNVCVAKELHRNGLGYALVAKAKTIAEDWGNHLETHVVNFNHVKCGHDLDVFMASVLQCGLKCLLWNFTGISDLYVHVAFDNEPAKNLYLKSGFVHESDEPAWQARFLDRPRRILLWTALSELLL